MLAMLRKYHIDKIIIAVILLALLITPLGRLKGGDNPLFNNSILLSFTQMFMLITLASNWNLTGGFTGYLDFGHAVFFGLGAYGTAIMMTKRAWGFGGALVIGAIVATVFAFMIGSATLRLKGPYFSIAMLGTFYAVREIIRVARPITNGGSGMTVPFFRYDVAGWLEKLGFANAADFKLIVYERYFFYYLTFFHAVLIIVLIWWIRRSEFGSSLVAIREDEVGAEMRGINTTAHKIMAFMIAAFSSGLVGGMWAFQNTFIDPDVVFFEARTLDYVMMTMLGGLGTVLGPAIGAVTLYWMRDVIWANFLDYHLVVEGVLLIIIVLFVPEGIIGTIKDPS
ncbi:MAG TPA: branched-chain amino acid ABC transporter permease, partial [Anaerolineae bacterium]|nr:branched-chain amino acid ABC transporter permease [Anaerolineae bacterium]